ncbi:rhodanese-like domain-containing protein [Romboutsia sp.]|uniref:rhodanese-like domain-containing protein n=1 Tax=Romboutsia sp. TaxID=1965302 RepID=UPI003F30D14A
MGVVVLKGNKVKQMIDNKEFDLIIDLRNRENYLAGHLPNAINIPLNEIPDNMDYLNQYKVKSIIMYCGIGIQSRSAAKVLALNGFEKIYSLSNGIKEYKYELVSE